MASIASRFCCGNEVKFRCVFVSEVQFFLTKVILSSLILNATYLQLNYVQVNLPENKT